MSLPRVPKASMLNQSIIHRRKEGKLLIEFDCFATSHTRQSLSVWGIVNAYRSSWCRALDNAKTSENGSTTRSLILFSDIKHLQLCCCISCHKFAAIRVCIQAPNLKTELLSYYGMTWLSESCRREKPSIVSEKPVGEQDGRLHANLLALAIICLIRGKIWRNKASSFDKGIVYLLSQFLEDRCWCGECNTLLPGQMLLPHAALHLIWQFGCGLM